MTHGFERVKEVSPLVGVTQKKTKTTEAEFGRCLACINYHVQSKNIDVQ